jgi:hypothetical protein
MSGGGTDADWGTRHPVCGESAQAGYRGAARMSESWLPASGRAGMTLRRGCPMPRRVVCQLAPLSDLRSARHRPCRVPPPLIVLNCRGDGYGSVVLVVELPGGDSEW